MKISADLKSNIIKSFQDVNGQIEQHNLLAPKDILDEVTFEAGLLITHHLHGEPKDKINKNDAVRMIIIFIDIEDLKAKNTKASITINEVNSVKKSFFSFISKQDHRFDKFIHVYGLLKHYQDTKVQSIRKKISKYLPLDNREFKKLLRMKVNQVEFDVLNH